MSKDTKKGEDFPSKVCSNKVFGVIGICGVVGNLVARVLMDNWYKVVGTDIKEESECQFRYTLENYHSPLYFGGHPEPFFTKSNFIIPPPSLSRDSDFFKTLKTNSEKCGYKIVDVEDVINLINPDKPVLCVTGTNGKTTTVSLLKHICSHAGLVPAEHGFKHLQGNIEYIPPLQSRLKGDVAVLETGTFGKPGDLKFVMERSKPDCGIITNITPDHMQDDQDFLKYAGIKGEFVDCLKDKKLIVNGDDPTVWGLIESRITGVESKEIITFGVDHQPGVANEKMCWCGRQIQVNETISGMGTYKCPCGLENPQIDYLATDIKDGSFTLKTPIKVLEVELPLIGLHNVYNTLGAVTAAKEFFNIPLKDIITSVKAFKGVPGRLDYIGEYDGKTVIIDYAHNPGGVETVLRELKDIYKPLAVVITISSESGEKGNTDILNKTLNNGDYVIPASYYSRKAADNLIKETGSDKIILTPKYPEKFKDGTLGANSQQVTEGLKTALMCDVQAVVCIGEAAFTYKEEIRKIVGQQEGQS